ncbi:MAG TPA: GNAT family N-acetyltransferase [Tepidiformaceae bacterium]|nr:GNAT family N-acetyltransferase [Tepidiformaceae bacterium]
MDSTMDGMHANMLRAVQRIGHLTERSATAEVGPWLLIDAGVDMARFNQAFVAASLDEPAAAVAQALAWFDARNSEPTFHLRDPMDGALAGALAPHGFEAIESEPAMYLSDLPAHPAPSPGLIIREVRDAPDIARYAEIDAPAWHVVTRGIARTVREFPDFTMLLGELNGDAVATSMAVVTDGIVGVYNVQVRPSHRGRGFGRALTAAAIEVGRIAGCTAATLQSTPMGLPLYTAMGFQTRYSVTVYARPQTLS